MVETKYYDNDIEEIVDYETASDRIYEDMTWDDLERFFVEGMQSGKFCISEFWHRLPEWMRIEIDDEAFNYAFNYRFDEVVEEDENG